MPPKHFKVGSDGEKAAVAYLEQLRYVIKDRNVRFGRDELDIVAYDRARKMMVFVEVKTRSAVSAAYPIRTAVDMRKRACLRRAIARWTTEHQYDGPGRIDIVCISEGKIIEHVMDIGSDFF